MHRTSLHLRGWPKARTARRVVPSVRGAMAPSAVGDDGESACRHPASYPVLCLGRCGWHGQPDRGRCPVVHSLCRRGRGACARWCCQLGWSMRSSRAVFTGSRWSVPASASGERSWRAAARTGSGPLGVAGSVRPASRARYDSAGSSKNWAGRCGRGRRRCWRPGSAGRPAAASSPGRRRRSAAGWPRAGRRSSSRCTRGSAIGSESSPTGVTSLAAAYRQRPAVQPAVPRMGR